jgi:simple sugar transport system permease protein
MTPADRTGRPSATTFLLAALISLVVFELAVLAWGESPGPILRALVAGTWGSRYDAGQVLFKATSILVVGAAAQVALRGGLFHVGLEGVIAIAALAVGAIGARLPQAIPVFVAWPLLTGCALVAGALWALPAGILRARFGAHEVLTGIMLNKIAAALVGWAFVAGLGHGGPRTAPLPEGARIGRLEIFPGAAANLSVVVGVVVAVALAVFAQRTVRGRNAAAIAASESAATAAGIAVGRSRLELLVLSGAAAGLVALNDVMGYRHLAEQGALDGLGFRGLAAALLAGRSPIGLFAASLFLATLAQGGFAINSRVPMEIVDVVVAVVLLLVAAAPALDRLVAGSRSSGLSAVQAREHERGEEGER